MLEQLTPKVTAMLPKSRRPAVARKSRRTILTLEQLEDRCCPSGPGAGPDGGGGGGNTDRLVWKPQTNNLSNQAGNWWDIDTNQRVNFIPTSSNPVFFDGTVANKPIEINGQIGAKSLTIQNGYQNTMTVDANFSFPTFGNDTLNSGCTLTLVPASGAGGIELDNANSFNILSGGTLKLTDAVGTTTSTEFFDSGGVAGDYINNAGTVTWYGTAVNAGNQSLVDLIKAPILNTGTFNADGGIKGNTNLVPGTLQISGQDANNTGNVSFYMTGGSLNLTNMAIAQLLDEYEQTGGTLTSDATTCTVESGLQGGADINIAGGKVVVDTVANSYATLNFLAGTVEINGEIDVNGLTLKNGQSTFSDCLNCGSAAVKLEANSYLNITTTGGFDLGKGNQWTVMKYGSITSVLGNNDWGNLSYPTGMAVSTGATQVQVVN